MAHGETTVWADGFTFLEAPRWHEGELWVADIGTGEVLVVTSAEERRRVVQVPGAACGMGFLPDGTPLVLSLNERKLYRIEGDALAPHADLSAVSPFLNDMVVDTLGRAYVGDFGFNLHRQDPAKEGTILLVQPDGDVSVVAKGLQGPNGCCLTQDSHLIVAETFANRLLRFRINPDGTLGDSPVVTELEGMPDGLCLDAEGAIWVALFDKDRFVRMLDGKVIDTIETPGRRAVACQLGGADGLTLFCLTFEGEVQDIGKAIAGKIEIATVYVGAGGSP